MVRSSGLLNFKEANAAPHSRAYTPGTLHTTMLRPHQVRAAYLPAQMLSTASLSQPASASPDTPRGQLHKALSESARTPLREAHLDVKVRACRALGGSGAGFIYCVYEVREVGHLPCYNLLGQLHGARRYIGSRLTKLNGLTLGC